MWPMWPQHCRKALAGNCYMMIRWFVNHLFVVFYALHQRLCMIGYSHFVPVKWSFQKSIIIYFPALSFLCAYVLLCTIDRSGRYSMNPRGALPQSVSDESPGRWQQVITERKTLRYKKSKRDKEDWCLSSRHTCENMPMTLSPFCPLSVLVSSLSYFLLSTSSNHTVTPLLLHCFFPLFTSGIYVNKSHLSSCCDSSIIAHDQLKITLWEQRE